MASRSLAALSSTYRILGVQLPLPSPLCARIHRQLQLQSQTQTQTQPHTQSHSHSHTGVNAITNGETRTRTVINDGAKEQYARTTTNNGPAKPDQQPRPSHDAVSAAQCPSYALQCDWTIDVETLNVPSNSIKADTLSPSLNSSTTTVNGNAANTPTDSSFRPSSSPLFPLSDLLAAHAFVASQFPFCCPTRLLEGLARVTLLLRWAISPSSQLSNMAARTSSNTSDTSHNHINPIAATPAAAAHSSVPIPASSSVRVRSVRGHARLVERPMQHDDRSQLQNAHQQRQPNHAKADHTLQHDISIEMKADQCSLLGRDRNAWGDVDILLEFPPNNNANDDSNPNTTAAPNPCNHIVHVDHASPSSPPSSPAVVPCPSCSSIPPSAGLYVLNLSPGHSIPLHIHRQMSESEMVLSRGVWCLGEAAPFGTVHEWGHAAHDYFNPTRTIQRILCIDVPKFIPQDEIILKDGEKEEELRRRTSSLNGPPIPTYMAGSDIWQEMMSQQRTHTPYASFIFPGGLAHQSVLLRTNPAEFERPHAVLLFVFKQRHSHPSTVASSRNHSQPPTATPILAPRLLFVHHRRRGWELPGGKVDAGETPEQAAARELMEEANVEIETTTLRQIAQYVLREDGKEEHVKTVFAAIQRRPHTTESDASPGPAHAGEPSSLQHETDSCRFIHPPVWQHMFSADAKADAALASATTPLNDMDSTSSSTDSISAAAHDDAHTMDMKFSSILADNVYPICLQLALAAWQMMSEQPHQ